MPNSHRLAAAALIGASGTLAMLAMLWPHWRNDWSFLLAAASGASGAGYAAAGFFGHPGQRGFGLGLLGAVLATLCGAALAGLGLGVILGQTIAGVVIGPMAVGQALLTSPLALMTWVGSMALAHLMIGQLRSRPLVLS